MMRVRSRFLPFVTTALVVSASVLPAAQPAPAVTPTAAAPAGAPLDPRLVRLKEAVAADIKSPAMFDLGQQMTDMVFSFGELGFQEFETQKYLTGILEKERLHHRDGVAGIPTAWVASWGSGKPVIALGSDVDCIPQASQKPGVAYRDPIIEGAPGHGEGHNSGMPLNIVAAIAVKRMMEREKLPGHDRDLAGDRRGAARHQGVLRARRALQGRGRRPLQPRRQSNLGHAVGRRRRQRAHLGRVHVQGRDRAQRRRAVARPIALDAVELMNIGWNFRREHLRTQQRSHYVITNGGDQPNVVPRARFGLVLLPRDRATRASRACGPSATRWPKGPR